MIHMNDIHPLTGFLRDHRTHLDRLRETGRPELLTVNGQARVVIQDAAAYQKLLEAAEVEDTIRRSIAYFDAGGPGIPAAEVLASARRILKLDETDSDEQNS